MKNTNKQVNSSATLQATYEEKKQNALSVVTQASKQAIEVFNMFKLENIFNAETARESARALKSISNASELVACVVMAHIRRNGYYKQCLNNSVTKPDYYKSFGRWAEEQCDISKAYADNQAMVGEYLDENALPLFDESGKTWKFTTIRDCLMSIKCDGNDDEKKATKLAVMTLLVKNGVISATMTAKDCVNAIKRWQANEIDDNGKPIENESNNESDNASDNESDNASDNEKQTTNSSQAEKRKRFELTLEECNTIANAIATIKGFDGLKAKFEKAIKELTESN